MTERGRFPARVLDTRWLTGAGSTRPTLHLALSIADSGFDVQPGDTVQVHCRNPPALVDAVMRRLGLGEDARGPLGGAISLGMPSLKLLRAIAERAVDEDEAIAVEDLCDDDAALDAYLRERDVLDVLDEHPTIAFSVAELVGLLPVLAPRTFSVASSRARHADQIHLTIGMVRWERAGRAREGVASAHLSSVAVGDTLPIGWQASAHFRLPEDPSTPLLCIGPGTGVAPFRGFLQQHRGPVWLFFGARTRAHDFYYGDELEALAAPHRLTLAFSRDGAERTYVQHRMAEASGELRAFVEGGAHVYLCGDGSNMAPAVEATLERILGDGSVSRLREQKRFHRDVY
jgi:sulfite reductase (NADPH) flavoprotein alpha-component